MPNNRKKRKPTSLWFSMYLNAKAEYTEAKKEIKLYNKTLSNLENKNTEELKQEYFKVVRLMPPDKRPRFLDYLQRIVDRCNQLQEIIKTSGIKIQRLHGIKDEDRETWDGNFNKEVKDDNQTI